MTIEWIVDANDLIEEGTSCVLEELRGIGQADIIKLELRDIEKGGKS